MVIDWDVAGNCSAPMTRINFARPGSTSKEIAIIPGKTRSPLQVNLDVRCRKCKNCLRWRGSKWTARAIYETRTASRTWFGTMTLSPGDHDYVKHLCRQKDYRTGNDWDTLTEEQMFVSRHLECSRYLTLWLKRIRKNSGADLRYMLVCEAHKSGLPHYHALIHEANIDIRVTKRVLQAAWQQGFSNFKLVPPDECAKATYACKYISKSSLARVRASRAYGGSQLQTK